MVESIEEGWSSRLFGGRFVQVLWRASFFASVGLEETLSSSHSSKLTGAKLEAWQPSQGLRDMTQWLKVAKLEAWQSRQNRNGSSTYVVMVETSGCPGWCAARRKPPNSWPGEGGMPPPQKSNSVQALGAKLREYIANQCASACYTHTGPNGVMHKASHIIYLLQQIKPYTCTI